MAMFIDFTANNPLQGIVASSEWEHKIVNFIESWSFNDTFPVKTSGSTGIPKEIHCHKTQMLASAKITGQYFQFEKGQTALHCLPTDKISGMMMLVRAIFWRLKLYCLAPKIELNIEQLPPIDFSAMLPAQALANIQQISKIKKLLLGGASLPSSLEHSLDKLPTESFLSYGMTETLSHIAIKRLNKTSTFETLEGVQIKTDQENRLIINAPQIGVEELLTNDIVTLHSPTQFEYIGRYDNIINSGGMKILPEQIEEQIADLFPDNDYYIGQTTHDTWGECIALFIESEPYAENKQSSLQKQLEFITPKQAIPKRIIFKSQFERTSNGKLIRNSVS